MVDARILHKDLCFHLLSKPNNRKADRCHNPRQISRPDYTGRCRICIDLFPAIKKNNGRDERVFQNKTKKSGSILQTLIFRGMACHSFQIIQNIRLDSINSTHRPHAVAHSSQSPPPQNLQLNKVEHDPHTTSPQSSH